MMTVIKNNSYILLIFAVCIGFAVMGVMKQEKEQPYTEVTIYEGDTLWSLALHHAEDQPAEQWIKEVMAMNGLATTTIRSGDDLRLPAAVTIGREPVPTQIAGGSR